MKRIVILRADAGKTIGYGHFIRSLALAEYLNGVFKCVFCTYNPLGTNPTQYQLREIDKVCQYRQIEADSIENYNQRFIDSLEGNEIVVLDNYYFRTDYQRKIREKGCRLVCIDDVHDRHMVADLLITGSPLERTSFSIEPYTHFCGGLKYSILRKDFLNVEISRKQSSPMPEKIVIAIGGADPYSLTNTIINILQKIDDNLELSVIAGDAVEIKTEYNPRITIHRRLSAKKIVDLFKWADLGIFPASTICIEALACQLPVAAGWYVDNQKEFYDYGVANSLFAPLGSFMVCETILEERLRSVLNASHHKTAPKIDFQQGKEEIIEIFKNL